MNKVKTIISKKVDILGHSVDIITFNQAIETVLEKLMQREGIHIVTINPEIISEADKNHELAGILRQAELVIPESAGIMLALKKLGIKKAEKIPGIEFSEALIRECREKGLKVAFIGGSPETSALLKEKMQEKFPGLKVVFSCHGYFKNEEIPKIREELLESDPHVLFAGLGSPKQEFFISLNKPFLHKTSMIGVGGSFDIWTGKVKRAPVFFRIIGAEWLYRLITQPSRFKRMFPVLPLFFLKVIFIVKK